MISATQRQAFPEATRTQLFETTSTPDSSHHEWKDCLPAPWRLAYVHQLACFVHTQSSFIIISNKGRLSASGLGAKRPEQHALAQAQLLYQ